MSYQFRFVIRSKEECKIFGSPCMSCYLYLLCDICSLATLCPVLRLNMMSLPVEFAYLTASNNKNACFATILYRCTLHVRFMVTRLKYAIYQRLPEVSIASNLEVGQSILCFQYIGPNTSLTI